MTSIVLQVFARMMQTLRHFYNSYRFVWSTESRALTREITTSIGIAFQNYVAVLFAKKLDTTKELAQVFISEKMDVNFVLFLVLFVVFCAFALTVLSGLCVICIVRLLILQEVFQERLSKRNRIGCVVVMDVPDATETDRQEVSFCKVVADATIV